MDVFKVFGIIGILFNLTGCIVCKADLLASRALCGYQHIDDYHRENENISIDEFPWMAQLLYNENRRSQCTGTLINTRYVLTAAHCITTTYAQLVAVRLGDFNITSGKDCIINSYLEKECSDPVQDFDIEEKIPHPGYTAAAIVNDIGLLRLSKNVEYSDYIRPICLTTLDTDIMNGRKLFTSGWGFTTSEGDQTTIKKKIQTTLISLEECKDKYKHTRIHVSNNHLCTLEDEKRTCQGDSGAPLMISTKHQWEQIGVLSFGNCRGRSPSGYMKVTSYLSWIIQNLKA